MPSVRRKRYVRAAVTAAAAAALVAVLVPTTWADPTVDDLTDGQQRARSAGIQLAPKGAASAKSTLKAPNPYLANLPDTKRADYSTWKQRMVAAGQQRAKSASLAANKTKAAGRSLGAAFVHDEEEPAGTSASNDSQAECRADHRFRHRQEAESAGARPRLDRRPVSSSQPPSR